MDTRSTEAECGAGGVEAASVKPRPSHWSPEYPHYLLLPFAQSSGGRDSALSTNCSQNKYLKRRTTLPLLSARRSPLLLPTLYFFFPSTYSIFSFSPHRPLCTSLCFIRILFFTLIFHSRPCSTSLSHTKTQ